MHIVASLIPSMASDAHTVFLDTAYLNARVNSRDQWYDTAERWEQRIVAERLKLVTTEFVLVEFAVSLATVQFRAVATEVIAILRSSLTTEIIPTSTTLFDAGLDLYARRSDKDWGLTDCMSFVVMYERGLYSALTTDDHFRQAGFRALLLEG